jgi:hypothetical protein
MKLQKIELVSKDETEWLLTIPHHFLVAVKLDAFDYKLLHECEGSGKISDTLLALEMLTRKIEEQFISQDSKGILK